MSSSLLAYAQVVRLVSRLGVKLEQREERNSQKGEATLTTGSTGRWGVSGASPGWGRVCRAHWHGGWKRRG